MSKELKSLHDMQEKYFARRDIFYKLFLVSAMLTLILSGLSALSIFGLVVFQPWIGIPIAMTLVCGLTTFAIGSLFLHAVWKHHKFGKEISRLEPGMLVLTLRDPESPRGSLPRFVSVQPNQESQPQPQPQPRDPASGTPPPSL